jgi:paired amphipathic helix protein Sin3a
MVSGAPPNPTAFQGSQGSQPLPQPTSTLPQGAAAAAGNAYRPLNVRDALTYLDQVKLQFQDEPEVYNKFLDIMKDFKSQAIDTPGVIERVSQLFRGHPQLIIGFNTFLPPGYRIDISNDRRTYTITTPHDGSYSSGAALPGVGGGNVRDARSNSVSGPPVQMVPGTAGPSSVSNSIQHALQAGGQHQIHAANPQQSLAPYEGHTGHQAAFMQQPVASNTNSATSSAALQQGAFGAASTAPAPIQSNMHAIKKPVEFNHAINYVNKIKNRFASDPETYKQFLEILRNYQNEVKPIGEVYSMIQQLFKGHPDLLDEFKHFLPDYNAPTNMPVPPQQTQRRQSISSGAVAGQKRKYAQAPAAVSNGAVTVQDKALRKAVPQIVRQRPNRYQPGGRWNVTEEFEFFERVKKHLANKTTYTEFLKVLNLFNQDIIDSKMLVERVEPFIGRNYELFEWFKRYVKFDADTAVDAEEYTYGGSRNQSSINHTNLFKVIADSKRSGSSYRLLPSNYVQPKSTGRDDLAVEVLNDQWVCHPTWASEDGGFIAHKKNQFEDALFRCEEERYEFDLNIEINRSVIQRLEAIWRKVLLILSMLIC